MTELPTPGQGAATVPAKDPEPGVAVLRLPWLHWPYVIVPLVALVMLLGAAAWAFPGLLARLQLGDYRAAERHIQEFAWPAELHDDPTFTACGGFVTRCARTELAPEAALRAALPALAAAGLDLGPVRCGPEAETSIWPRVPRVSDCTAEASAGGYSVHARATEYAPTPDPSGALRLGFTQVSLFLSPESERLAALVEPTSASRTHAPLPVRAADVPGLPALLRSLACTQPEGDGCRIFAGTITLADPNAAGLDALAAQLADELRGGGYLVNFESCRDVDAGRRCTVGGEAFRTAGGNDLTVVSAILSLDAAGGPTVLANVSAL
jgi:hypothetical protein